MRIEQWFSGWVSHRRRQRRPVSTTVAAVERLEARIVLGDIALTALGLHGLPGLLASSTEFAAGGAYAG